MPEIQLPNATPASVFASYQDLFGSHRKPWPIFRLTSTLAQLYEAVCALRYAGGNLTGSDTTLWGDPIEQDR